MKKGLKKWTIAAAAAVTALAVCIPAYASSDYTEIKSIKLKCNDFEEPEAGDNVGSISFTTSDSRYKVTECEYDDEMNDEWERGATPIVNVTVEVEDEDKYRFKLSKSDVSVSGCHGECSSISKKDSGRTYEIKFKLRKVSGDIEDIDENYWDGRTAVWTDIEDGDKYEVKLYKGSRTVATVTTTNNSYNFYPYMSTSGDYSFKVRAVSTSDDETSEWTELSDDYEMSASNVYTGTPPTNGNTGSTGNGTIGWGLNQNGWYYLQNNGMLVANNWLYVDNNWFLFDGNGYMMTGLQLVGNQWFYLNPISDGTRGAMLTGVQAINNGIYYFNPVSDGSRGAMLTGFQFINNQWYYFDTGNGMLWSNRNAPNGRWIDGAGVVHVQ